MSHLKDVKDRDISLSIGNILRWGVYISLSIVFIGGMVYLYRRGQHHNIFIGYPFVEKDESIIHLIRDTFIGIANGRGYYIIELGIVFLILTPLTRVIFSLIAFLLERDYLYVLITFIVLTIISFSILSGLGG